MTGKSKSADRAAFSTLRIMPICTVLGQAAGTVSTHLQKSGVDLSKVDIKELRRTLIKQGVLV